MKIVEVNTIGIVSGTWPLSRAVLEHARGIAVVGCGICRTLGARR